MTDRPANTRFSHRARTVAAVVFLAACTLVLSLIAGSTGRAQFFGMDMGTLPDSDPNAFAPNASAYLRDRIREVAAQAQAAAALPPGTEREAAWKQLLDMTDVCFESGAITENVIETGATVPSPEAAIKGRTPAPIPIQWVSGIAGLDAVAATLPPDGLAAWRKHYADRASVEYQFAAESQDLMALIPVVARFGLTDGGVAAARMLGDLSFEQGRFDLGAWAYQRLARNLAILKRNAEAGPVAARLAVCLRQLGRRDALASLAGMAGAYGAETPVAAGDATVSLAAHLRTELDACADALTRPAAEADLGLTTLTPSGFGVARALRDLRPEEWAVPISPPKGDPYNDRFTDYLQPELPPYLPVVHHSLVLVNSGSDLCAFDLFRGLVRDRPVWQASPFTTNDASYHLIETDPNLVLSVSAWRNYAFAALENPLDSRISDPGPSSMMLRPKYPIVRRALTCVDSVTGKVQWMLGGQYVPSRKAASLSDLARETELCSFHHSIVDQGVLYAVATRREGQAEVFLYAIEPQSGKILWRISLCQGQVENTMFGAPSREPLPGVPVVADGMLYLVSNLGGVVAVDLAARGVSWVARYDSLPRPYTRERDTFYRKRTFANGSPVVFPRGGGAMGIVVAPTDSRFLTCLDAATGAQLWSTPVETKQTRLRETNDLGPTALAGVLGEFAYVAQATTLIPLRLKDGAIQQPVTVTARVERAAGSGDGTTASTAVVTLALSGRPAVVEGALLWPGKDQIGRGGGAGAIATIPLPLPTRPVDGSTPVGRQYEALSTKRDPGNLIVRSGMVIASSGRDYMGARIGSSSDGFPPTLSAHFNLSTLVAEVKRGLVERPDDPDMLLSFAMLSGQLMRSKDFTAEQVEQTLRRALKLAETQPAYARVADMARRGLFDRFMAAALAASDAGNRAEFASAIDSAASYATGDGQQRDIFIMREADVVNRGTPAEVLAFYGAGVADQRGILISDRLGRWPLAVYCRLKRAEKVEKTQPAAAVADWQMLLEWALANGGNESVTKLFIGNIARIRREVGATAYAGIEERAAALLTSAQGDPTGITEHNTAGLSSVIRQYPNSTAALAAMEQLVEIRTASGDPARLGTEVLKPLDLRGVDAESAPVVMRVILAYEAAGLGVAAYTATGRLAGVDGATRVLLEGRMVSVSEFLTARRAKLPSGGTPALVNLALPLSTESRWRMDGTPGQYMTVAEQPEGENDILFFSGQNSNRALRAIDVATGDEKWTGPEMIGGQPRVHRSGSRLIVFDAYAAMALDRETGDVVWRVNTGGMVAWSRLFGGIGVAMVIESGDGQNTYSFIGVDCEQGAEAWRCKLDNFYPQNITVGGYSLYAVSINGAVRTLFRVDLANGEKAATAELTRYPATPGGVQVLPDGRLAVVMSSGEIEVRDPVTLLLVTTWAGTVRSVRSAAVAGGALIVIGNLCDAAAIDVATGQQHWAVPSVTIGATQAFGLTATRLVLITNRYNENPRRFAAMTYDVANGTLVKDATLCELTVKEGNTETTTQPNGEPTVFSAGMAIPMFRQRTTQENGIPTATVMLSPVLCVVDTATGEVRKSEAPENAEKQYFPMNVRVTANGLAFATARTVVFYAPEKK